MVATPVLNFDLDAYATPRRQLIEQSLEQYTALCEPESLWQSMRYSLLSGGKRFRALLCLASAEAMEHLQPAGLTAVQAAMPCACALEMIHAMSLIHDDLPCMDNDDFRRGKPTNHKVFGEAMALLAGDALLVLATEVLLRKTPLQVDRQCLIEVAAELARATGPDGMVGGQVSDSIATGLVVPTKSLSEQAGLRTPVQADAPTAQLLESIHKRKTGALLRFATWSGARLMQANEDILSAFTSFGEVLGLAFQIADDLLDLTGDLQSLGKTPGKDQAAGKLTWVSIYGEEGSRRELALLESQGKSLLASCGLPDASTTALRALLSYAIHRRN
ncbi:MAG TPA: polyprenyl synthetase family protein [Candidatus Obscuribacterales bacterium]